MDGSYGVSAMVLGDLHYTAYSKAAWQPDGSLKLTNYELQPVDSAGGLGETIIPDYQVVSTEQRPAEPHEVALLYP